MSSYLDATKSEYDDSQLSSHIDSQFDSQLTVARGPLRSAASPISTVLKLPSNLATIRQHAFALNAELTWSADDYALYWPFVDNLWVHNHTERLTKKLSQKSYWYCRLWKDDADIKTKGKGRRAKRMRFTDPCPMKLAMIKQFDEANNLLSVSLSLHLSKKSDVDRSQHNHTLEFLDDVKINSAIKLVAGQEVARGYTPAVVNKNMQGIKWEGNFEALKEAGGSGLNQLNPDVRMLRAKESWLDQLDDCFDRLQSQGEDTLSAKLRITRNIDEEKSYAIAFAKRSRLSTLMRRGHLALMDSTHNINQLKWKLFTVMVRDEHGSWIPGAHMLTDHEDGNIIGEFLRQIKRWSRAWRLRYMITDDSAAEQRAVSLVFRGLIDGEMEVSHFLCRTHSERTLNRKLAGAACKNVKKHLYDALYFRKTEMECDDSLRKAIKSAPMEKRQYRTGVGAY